MRVQVLVIGGDEDMTKATELSVALSLEDRGIQRTVEERDINKSIELGLVHIIRAGVIVLPSFYKAMLVTIENSGLDYVQCDMLNSSDGSVIKNESTTIFRKWIVDEIGFTAVNKFFAKLTGEFKSCSVPHVMCVGL